jgi:hypothetical protein
MAQPFIGTLPQTPNTLVLRTDFSDGEVWDAVCDQIRSSSCEGFVEQYTCISDLMWSDLPNDRLTMFDPPPYFYFVVDRLTIEHDEHPVLAVSLQKEESQEAESPQTFRLVPGEATALACNLNTANMDFSEFAANTDSDGIFRGFKS